MKNPILSLYLLLLVTFTFGQQVVSSAGKTDAGIPAQTQFTVTVQNVRNNFFLITWTVSPGAAKYEVKVRRASQDYWVNIPEYPLLAIRLLENLYLSL